MAPISKTLALVGALFALTGYSAPVAKRAVVWEVVTDIVWTTVEVTVTVDPQATHTTVAPVVATTTTATTTTAAAVQALAQEPEKVAPTTTSSTTTAAATTTTVKEQEKAAPTTTSSSTTTTAAPVPTVEAYSAPAPVVEAAETSTTAPAITRATNTETTGSSGHTGACSESSPCEGEITFYDTATTVTNPSSCGNTNDGTVENVLALPHGIMQDGDCGKTVTITYNGQTATGIVVDKCMGCSNGDVDLSRHLFGELASFSKGRVSGAKWYIH
jgi:hypothetical protein